MQGEFPLNGLSIRIEWNAYSQLVAQSLSRAWIFATPWNVAHQEPHGMQHIRLLCLPLSPEASSNSCPLSQWCYLTISFSAIPFSICLHSFPTSRSFPISQIFALGGQNIAASASASVLPMTLQGWFPLGFTGWISLQSKKLSRVFSSTTIQKHQFFHVQPSLRFNSHIHVWLSEKPQLWLYCPLLAKWCLCFLICCLGLSLLSFQGVSVF